MCLVMFVIVHGSNGNTCVNMPIHISQTYTIYFEGGGLQNWRWVFCRSLRPCCSWCVQ